MTKQVELIVRLNYEVPIDVDSSKLTLNIPSGFIQVIDGDSQLPVAATRNEYETMEVYEP